MFTTPHTNTNNTHHHGSNEEASMGSNNTSGIISPHGDALDIACAQIIHQLRVNNHHTLVHKVSGHAK